MTFDYEGRYGTDEIDMEARKPLVTPRNPITDMIWLGIAVFAVLIAL